MNRPLLQMREHSQVWPWAATGNLNFKIYFSELNSWLENREPEGQRSASLNGEALVLCVELCVVCWVVSVACWVVGNKSCNTRRWQRRGGWRDMCRVKGRCRNRIRSGAEAGTSEGEKWWDWRSRVSEERKLDTSSWMNIVSEIFSYYYTLLYSYGSFWTVSIKWL